MLFFRLLEISVIHPAKCKLPSIREICICMLVYAYENEVENEVIDIIYVGELEIHTVLTCHCALIVCGPARCPCKNVGYP